MSSLRIKGNDDVVVPLTAKS